MNAALMDFLAKIAWPFVALVGILILGPGGLLRRLVSELATNLFQITDAINQFKKTANDFHISQQKLSDSTQWVAGFDDQLRSIVRSLENISVTTQELAISEGNRSLERAVAEEPLGEEKAIETKSVEEMFVAIRDKWDALVAKLRVAVGPDFDARSVGQMAWKLVDKRRANQLVSSDAELFERLHSQMKRFNRLQSSRDEWLTHEVYAAFIRGVDQADTALEPKRKK